MPPIVHTRQDAKVPVHSWTEGVPFDHKAQEQLFNVASLDFIHHHVAVMPDVHVGIGATVGSVIPTYGAVIPAAVGVDIGCGMAAVRLEGVTASDLPDTLKPIRDAIEKAVPVGRGGHQEGSKGYTLYGGDGVTSGFLAWLRERHAGVGKRRKDPLEKIVYTQYGSLGGGNHFIELCLDEDDAVWIMLHSGSRGIGNLLGTYFIELAREDMRLWMINLPDRDLAYFPEGTEHYGDYMRAVGWAQEYALENRRRMLDLIVAAIAPHIPPFRTGEEAVECHHNYVTKENHFGKNVLVTRKGAVRARRGDLGIIPGSMGARSYIVRGLGNPDSFHSCSHGAGRVMSRGQAKKEITLEDHAAATRGVECRKDEGVLDESPAAYKPIDAVMAAQEDLVEVVHELRAVVCVKG